MAAGARARLSSRAWLGAAVLCALAAAAAWWPGLGASAAPGLVAVLVDVSASAVRSRSGWREWRDGELRREAASSAGQELLVAAYSDGFEVLYGPASAAGFGAGPARASSLTDGASDLAGALHSLLALAHGRSLERVIVLGDGQYDGGEPHTALAPLRAAGASFEVRPPPAPDLHDVALDELRAPQELEAGAPLAAAVRLRSRGAPLPAAARIDVEFSIVDSNGERTLRTHLSAERIVAGEASTVVALGPLAAGRTRIEARAQLAGVVDVALENNAASAALRSRGARVVGVLARRPERFATWLADLRALAGLHVLAPVTALEELDLAPCDLLATLEVDPRELDAPRVREFVRRGGGWLALGMSALRSAKSAGAAHDLTELLPLELETDRPRDLLLVLDGSGSMDAAALDELRTATLALARAAAPNERVRLTWFTDQLGASFELSAGLAEQAREENLSRWSRERAPGGPTDIAAVLAHLARERAAAGPALCVLISDGRDQRERGAGPAALDERVAALALAGVRLAVVAAGPQADRAWLDQLARTTAHARAWSADDGTLLDALEREVLRDVADARCAVVRLASAAAGEEAQVAALRAAWSTGPAFPAAGEALRLRPRVGDALLLECADGRPWLALRRFGAGECAVLTGEPSARSSPEWERSATHLGPLLRTLARGGASSAAPRARAVRLDDGGWRLEGLPLEFAPRVWVADAARPAERAPADLPHAWNARDPRAVRVARGLRADGARELVLSDGAGAELLRIALERRPSPEFAGASPSLPPGELRPLGPRGGLNEVSPGRRRFGVAASVAGLLALVAALACSNWVPRALERQVFPPGRR